MGGTGGAEMVAPFELTSPSLAEQGEFLAVNTCDGANTSPELSWGPGPEGTLSYAISFVDQSSGFPHWAIWNIPGGTLSLMENLGTTLPDGAEQVSFNGGPYAGPCPGGPDPGNEHTYVFTLYALGVADFNPNAGDAGGVRNALEGSGDVLDSVTLGGRSLAGN
jgi:Raf kinase inhibitor-like YbhB/YbcL family protein